MDIFVIFLALILALVLYGIASVLALVENLEEKEAF